MENVKINEKKIKRPHSVRIENRSGGTVSGVEKLVSATADEIALITSEGGLTVTGADIKLERYSVEDGNLTFSGKVNAVKYSGAKVPLIKRIFK